MASYIENRKARRDYTILETLEAGIVLAGYEVKALRTGKGSLEGAHAVARGGEVFLVGMSIAPYQPKNTPIDYEPDRARKLLLNKKEMLHIAETEGQKGLTIVPLSVYNKGRFVKVSLGIMRGKKKYDKREDLKKRESDRDIERSLKRE
ncbi:MAG: SsrA-binding protein SmpB [Patescibacteria group bacterium]